MGYERTRRAGAVMLGVCALFAAGCASTKVVNVRRDVEQQQIPKPERILVYDIAATPDDVPDDAAISGRYDRREQAQTSEEVELGRKLGATVAEKLVEEIRAMGLPAQRASGSGIAPREGDLLIKGEFVKIDAGSRMKRMLIGFGAGASELQTHIEAYQVTAEGPRRLGSAQIETQGGKMPGMLVPVGAGAAAGRAAKSAAIAGGVGVAKEVGSEGMNAAAQRTAEQIAELLSEGFVRQGWISP